MAMIDFLGYIAGLLVVGFLLPQVVKSLRTKSTKDISLWRYIIYAFRNTTGVFTSGQSPQSIF